MKEIPQEKVIEKFESLPETLQDLILGDTLSDFVAKVASQNRLSVEQTQTLSTLIGDFIMGFSTDEEFVKEVKQDLELQEVVAKTIIEEVKKNILGPTLTLNNSKATLEQEVDQPPQEESIHLHPTFVKEPPIIPQGPETTEMVPAPIQAPPQQEEVEPVNEAPLILHKEEEVEPAKETPSYSTQRPAFYKPTFSEEYKRSMEAESAARVELGEETKKTEPRAERTLIQPTRIVHYSEFKTPLSPFENAGETQTQDTIAAEEQKKIVQQAHYEKDAKPSSIHPNNVIDLKDLPLE